MLRASFHAAALTFLGVLACASTPRSREVEARPSTVGRAAITGARVARLRIIATNDFHGGLEARADANGVSRGGVAALATMIRRARAECAPPACRSVWLDGGDEFQGTPASNLAFGRPVVSIFNTLGLAAAALGNHEFDWGLDSLRARMRQARYPILGANVTDTLGRDITWIPDDTLLDVGGLRVGVIGIATVETPTTTRPSNVALMRFVDPVPVVDRRARALRSRGANVVIVVAHAGAFCDRKDTSVCRGEIVDLAGRLTERVDAIVSGHTHSPVATIVNGIPIVQAFSRGTAIGVIDLSLGAGGGAPAVALRNVRPDSAAADPEVARLAAAAIDGVRGIVERPVAEIAERMEIGIDQPLGNLIADAQRAAGRSDVAVMNGGGVRAPLNAGPANFGSLFEVQPFGNVLVRISIRGGELRSFFEQLVGRDRVNAFLSGARVTWDRSRPAGSRITAVTMHDGKPLDERAVYTLVVNDYLAAGGDGLNVRQRALALEELQTADVDALAAYVRSLPQPVRAPTDARLIPARP